MENEKIETLESVDETKTVVKSDKNELKFGAKILSKIAMVLSGLWILGMTVLKGMGKIDLSMNEIIVSAVGLVGVWTPTYLSTWFDKIKEIKMA